MLWVGGVTLAGYLFGNIPWVKEHLDKIIWAAILMPGAAGDVRRVEGARPRGSALNAQACSACAQRRGAQRTAVFASSSTLPISDEAVDLALEAHAAWRGCRPR